MHSVVLKPFTLWNIRSSMYHHRLAVVILISSTGLGWGSLGCFPVILSNFFTVVNIIDYGQNRTKMTKSVNIA